MKLIVALAAVLTSAALTVPTVSGSEANAQVRVASAGTDSANNA